MNHKSGLHLACGRKESGGGGDLQIGAGGQGLKHEMNNVTQKISSGHASSPSEALWTTKGQACFPELCATDYLTYAAGTWPLARQSIPLHSPESQNMSSPPELHAEAPRQQQIHQAQSSGKRKMPSTPALPEQLRMVASVASCAFRLCAFQGCATQLSCIPAFVTLLVASTKYNMHFCLRLGGRGRHAWVEGLPLAETIPL